MPVCITTNIHVKTIDPDWLRALQILAHTVSLPKKKLCNYYFLV